MTFTYLSVGLLDRWYDGCAGWVRTVARDQVFAFSEQYMTGNPAHFIVAKDKASSFNPDNISGKTIG